MFKVLIIDDEEPARRAIKALGAWEDHLVSELLEAENGRRGLELLAGARPDIVFVDMRMPLVGGVEFLEQGRAISDAQFVVISGFDEFEYARRAMQAGALDYLLKPIKRTELNRVLAKAVEQIERARVYKQREASRAMLQNISAPLVKEKIYASIIDRNGRFHQIKELEDWLGAAGGECFYTVVLLGLNLSEVCRTRFFGDVHACHYALSNAINELLLGLGSALTFKSHKEAQEFVAVLSSGVPIDASQGRRVLEGVLHMLQMTFGLQAAAGFCPEAYPLGRLDASYQASKALLLQTDMLQKQRVTVYPDPGNRPGNKNGGLPRPSLLERQDLLDRALESGSALQALQVFRDYVQELRRSGSMPIGDMLKTASELRLVAERLSSEATGEAALLFAEPVTDADSYAGRLLIFAEWWTGEALRSRRTEEKASAERIKEYIDLHYFEDISIAYFTEIYYLSKEHLLRLFKQKYGCGIYEYTLKVRMEKAKELLADPSLKIQTVCQKVGYHEQNYFSKAFRKHCGVSPQEYRQQLFSAHKSAAADGLFG